MSRILRRPMFRGGRVDGRGTGIASGLGYKKGGRVALEEGGAFLNTQANFANGGIASLANGGVSTSGGFGRSPIYRFGERVMDYGVNPLLNAVNQGIVNPVAGLFGYGDLLRRIETPYDNKFVFGDEDFTDKYKKKYTSDLIEIDSGAIPKAIRQNQDKILEEELLKNFKNKNKNNNNNNNNNNEPSTDDLMGIDKEKFAKLLGSKEARGEDISNMLLSFAGKALKPEATVKGAFGEFFEEEAKRPSSKTKIDQAAAQLAINKYIKGEISKTEMEKLVMLNRTKISDQIELQKAALTLDTALQAGVKNGVGSSKKSIAVIQSAVEQVYGDNFNFGGPLPGTAEEINVNTIYVKDNEQSSGAKDLVYIDPKTGNLEILKTIF